MVQKTAGHRGKMVLKGPHTDGGKFVQQLIYPSNKEKKYPKEKYKNSWFHLSKTF